MDLKDKKVLLVGLGILGGGLSMAKALIKAGAKLTITDLRTEKELNSMLSKLPKNLNLSLGKHQEKDFEKADLIIFNPAVPFSSPWIKLAKDLDKPFFNDYSFFLKNLESRKPKTLIIGVTGTRGKTTISSWINHLIPGSVLAGNIPEKNLLKAAAKKSDVFVLELSSYQLEYAKGKTSPNIVVFTNLYNDHLNRYKNFKEYKKIKFRIFENQTEKDVLVLNADEPITKEILDKKPKVNLFFVSLKGLPSSKNGMFFADDVIFYQYQGKKSKVKELKNLARHEKTNLLFSMLVAHLVGVPGETINELLDNIPKLKFREEVIIKTKSFTVVNDSAATNPEATMAAIEKFKGQKNLILITGGTDKNLDYGNLAKEIKANILPQNLFLLSGSATEKLIKELKAIDYPEMFSYENLEDIIDVVSSEYSKGLILFSPASASFEKFKNEFDRGEKFNRLVHKYFSQ